MRPCIANRRGQRIGRRRRAFTLVEMLAALTIGALLVVAAVSATRALAETRRS